MRKLSLTMVRITWGATRVLVRMRITCKEPHVESGHTIEEQCRSEEMKVKIALQQLYFVVDVIVKGVFSM